MVASHGTGDDTRDALGDPTYRPGERGMKGRGVRGVGLLHEAGGVDLIVQNYHGTGAAGCLADRYLHGGEKVRRAIGAREGGVAHGTRYDDRLVPIHQ